MTNQEFERLYKEFTNQEEELLSLKREEYWDGIDRLYNFKAAGELLARDPEEVCLSYLVKHLLVIVNAVNGGEYNWIWGTATREGLKQRIADARNYLLLLAACIEEEFQEQIRKEEREAACTAQNAQR